MAELTISPDVIRDALKDFVAAYEPSGSAANEVGTVVDAADGIAHVEVDARGRVERRHDRGLGLSGGTAHYFEAFPAVSDSSSSARKRSTTA